MVCCSLNIIQTKTRRHFLMDFSLFVPQVAALNQSLVRTVVTTEDDVAEMDTFPALEGEDASKMQVMQHCQMSFLFLQHFLTSDPHCNATLPNE